MKFYVPIIPGNFAELVETTEATRWASAFSGDRVIHKHTINDIEISTVYIGIEREIFETMVFGGKLDGTQKRYDTLKKAKDGHWETLLKVCEKEGTPEQYNFYKESVQTPISIRVRE